MNLGFWKGFSTGQLGASKAASGGGGGGGDDPSVTIFNNLMAYWKMDEASGNRLDSTGNGHHMVPVNAVTQTAGKVGNSAHTDATQGYNPETEQYLYAPAHAELAGGNNQSFSIAMWVYVDNLEDDSPNFFSRGEDVSVEYSLKTDTVVGGSEFYFEIVGNHAKACAYGLPLTTGEWHFLVAWYDSAAITSYLQVDGGSVVQDSRAGLTADVTVDATADTLIGATYHTEPYNFMSGRVDETGFWHRILTAEERAYLYNSGNGRTLYP